jgi:uncharacterized protein YfbU (UPF0304 family)
MTKEQALVRKDLAALCSYAKGAQQYSNINVVVDNLKGSILHRIEQMENTLALNMIVLNRMVGEIKEEEARLVIDTYDEEGNQD